MFSFKHEGLYTVQKILNENTLDVDGLIVKLLGIKIIPDKYEKAKEYLEKFVKGKQVFLKFDTLYKPEKIIC